MIGFDLSTLGSVRYYIDVGTTSLIVQFIIAGAVIVLFFIKRFWRKMTNFFKRNKRNGG